MFDLRYGKSVVAPLISGLLFNLLEVDHFPNVSDLPVSNLFYMHPVNGNLFSFYGRRKSDPSPHFVAVAKLLVDRLSFTSG